MNMTSYLESMIEASTPDILSDNQGLHLVRATDKSLRAYSNPDIALQRAVDAGHSILDHSIGVSRRAVDTLHRITPTNIQLAIAAIAGMIHDWGKPILDFNTSKNKVFSTHDSIHLESILRLGGQGLSGVAQAVRHTPKLVMRDIANRIITPEQLSVVYADTVTNRLGLPVSTTDRMNDVIDRKPIDPTGQLSFIKKVSNIDEELATALQNTNVLEVTFVERCDGRYPVTTDPRTHGKLSSLHLAQHLGFMGLATNVVVSGDGSSFNAGQGVTIRTVQDYTDVDRIVDDRSALFITGWTSYFQQKRDKGHPANLVMRSLLGPSLTHDRRQVMREAGKQCIFVSQASAREVGIDPETASIQGNGYNPETFYYRDSPILNQIAFVGAPIHEKGIDHLIALAYSMPETSFIIAGDSEMYGRSDTLGEIPPNVTTLGEVSHDEVRELYLKSAASVFLTDPRRIFETYGKSAMEAALCGTPLVYLKNGGLETTVMDHHLNTGFDAFNISEFSNTLRKLITNKDTISAQRLHLSEQAKAFYPTWKEVAARFLALSSEAILDSPIHTE